MDIVSVVAFILYLALGIVFCFFGNRWVRVIVAIYGFIAVFLLANTLLPLIAGLGDTEVLLISIGGGRSGCGAVCTADLCRYILYRVWCGYRTLFVACEYVQLKHT